LFLSDLQQLTDCRRTLLPVLREAEESAIEMAENGLSTIGLRGVKSVKIQRAIVLVGMFSLLESALQAELDWKEPIRELKRVLGERGESSLASSVQRYELVVNTLKHGFGRSHTALVDDQERSFAVRRGLGDMDPDEYVDIDNLLVDVTNALVEECADTIEMIVDHGLGELRGR